MRAAVTAVGTLGRSHIDALECVSLDLDLDHV